MRIFVGIVWMAAVACIYHPTALVPADGFASGDDHVGGDVATAGDPGDASGPGDSGPQPGDSGPQPVDPMPMGDGPQPTDPVSLGDAGPLIVDSNEEAWLESAGGAAGCVTDTSCTSWGFTFTIDSGGWVVNIDGDHINPVIAECLEQMVANVRFPNRAGEELSASIPCV